MYKCSSSSSTTLIASMTVLMCTGPGRPIACSFATQLQRKQYSAWSHQCHQRGPSLPPRPCSVQANGHVNTSPVLEKPAAEKTLAQVPNVDGVATTSQPQSIRKSDNKHAKQQGQQQLTRDEPQVVKDQLKPPQPQYSTALVARVAFRSLLYVFRRLTWGSLRVDVVFTNMLFVLGVIFVNYGVESLLDFYLGDSPIGSLGCILLGAGVLVYIKLNRISVARTLLQGFWN